MQRRLSIPNGYPNRPGTRMLPPSYQPEPIPMITGSIQSFQPIPMAPQYKTSSINHNNNRSYKTPSAISTNGLIPSSYKQPPPMDTNYANQSYYHTDIQPDDDNGENSEISCWSKPLCLGLTRLSGGILFGTMIFLAVASTGGLITSLILYLQDVTTDPQWKILGMVVCGIMLLTVLVTLCIFIYCYKKGRIVNNKTNSLTPQFNQDDDYRHPYNYGRSPVPYGMIQNITPSPLNDDIVQVQDKLTNTKETIAPLRPRDIQRGVWQGNNAYGGLSNRPIEPPKMTHRVIQALPHDIDQIPSKQQRNQVVDIAPQTIVRLPGKHSRRFIEPQPQYEIVEEVITKPKKRSSQEYVEIIQLPKNERNKQRFNKVSVKHVKPIPEPEVVQDAFSTDHFYQ